MASVKTTVSYDRDADSFQVSSAMNGIVENELVPRTSALSFGSAESRIKGAIESTRSIVQQEYSKELEVKQILERIGALVEVVN